MQIMVERAPFMLRQQTEGQAFAEAFDRVHTQRWCLKSKYTPVRLSLVWDRFLRIRLQWLDPEYDKLQAHWCTYHCAEVSHCVSGNALVD
jgi:hypothetical protein